MIQDISGLPVELKEPSTLMEPPPPCPSIKKDEPYREQGRLQCQLKQWLIKSELDAMWTTQPELRLVKWRRRSSWSRRACRRSCCPSQRAHTASAHERTLQADQKLWSYTLYISGLIGFLFATTTTLHEGPLWRCLAGVISHSKPPSLGNTWLVETELESVHNCQPGNVHVLASES